MFFKKIIIGLIIITAILGGMFYFWQKNKESQVLDYLQNNVPEIKTYEQKIKSATNGQNKMIIRFDAYPNATSTDPYGNYYQVYVGEDLTDHTVRWNTFYITNDLSKIMVDDILTGEIISLEEWRQNNTH